MSNVKTFNNYDYNTKIKLFGTYENYLLAIDKLYEVNEEFLYNFYPEKINDQNFKLFLMELNPINRTNVSAINDIYNYINQYNDINSKIIVFSKTLNEEVLKNLIVEMNNIKKNIIYNLNLLGYDTNHLSELLLTINKNKMKSIILDSTFKDNLDEIISKNTFFRKKLIFYFNL